jgi:hypothetical protein
MTRRLLTLTMLLPLQLGCGSTWSRSSAGEVPLHRSVWGLQQEDPPCTLDEEEWEERCNSKNYGDEKICPKGCPPSEPEKDIRRQRRIP